MITPPRIRRFGLLTAPVVSPRNCTPPAEKMPGPKTRLVNQGGLTSGRREDHRSSNFRPEPEAQALHLRESAPPTSASRAHRAPGRRGSGPRRRLCRDPRRTGVAPRQRASRHAARPRRNHRDRGARQGEFRVWRVETQISSLPATEPVRFDVKYIVFSSLDKMAAWSSNSELIGAGRWTTGAQSEYFCPRGT